MPGLWVHQGCGSMWQQDRMAWGRSSTEQLPALACSLQHCREALGGSAAPGARPGGAAVLHPQGPADPVWCRLGSPAQQWQALWQQAGVQ